ncbi:hypothetical protein ACOMHN_023060 [Nucella lapillus]
MCRVVLRMKCVTQSRLLQNVLCRVENDEVYAVRRCDIVITVTVVMKNTTLGSVGVTADLCKVRNFGLPPNSIIFPQWTEVVKYGVFKCTPTSVPSLQPLAPVTAWQQRLLLWSSLWSTAWSRAFSPAGACPEDGLLLPTGAPQQTP